MSAHRRVLSARLKTSAAVLATGIGATAAVGALASPAAAASGDAWDAVRQCESGGNYSTNTGNGYYGAYQFSMQTWRGLGMSGRPSDASPAVQDQAARRLAGQYGMKPWPNCGKRYGGHTPASGGGSHHVRARSASATSGAGAASRGTPRHRAYRARHETYQSHESHQRHRSHQRYRSDEGHWSHWRYGSGTTTAGAVRVLSVRLVGQTRTDVRLYQLALDRVGYHLVVDGRFGRHTRLATMHFQAAHRLVVDGLAGPHTKGTLLRALTARH